MHKIFNEFQARKYIKNYGMSIVGVRPANVTGPDKVRGSVDHVQIMVDAARGKPVHLPQKGLMRLLVHVEDMAEVFTRVLLAEAPRHSLYNSGGIPVSLGELADIVRGFLPEAKITFDKEGGREDSGNYLVDWSRLAKEFGIEYPGLHTRVLEVINDVRRAGGAAAGRRALSTIRMEDRMRYNRISADCHLDLIWLPPDLFVSEAPAGAEGADAVRRRRAGRPAVGGQERGDVRSGRAAWARRGRSTCRASSCGST